MIKLLKLKETGIFIKNCLENHNTDTTKDPFRTQKLKCEQCKLGFEQTINRREHVNNMQENECKYGGNLFRKKAQHANEHHYKIGRFVQQTIYSM